jgi:kynurenine formamidase
MIDLSHKFYNGMQTYNSSWHVKYELSKLGSFNKVGRETKKIVMGSHCGTHIDAPRHFVKNGKTIENINIKKFYGEAEILKFTNLKQNYKIEVKDLKKKIK